MADKTVLQDSLHCMNHCFISTKSVCWNTIKTNITAGIKSAKVFVLIYSAHAVESKWVLRELTLADDNQLFVVPYNIDGSDLDSKFELILARLQWINASPRYGKYNFEELLGVAELHIGSKPKMSGLIENNIEKEKQ